MWFNRLFRRKNHETPEQREQRDATINQGIYYLYLIIILQIVFVFGLLGVIMLVGKVIVTPLWVFLFVLLLAVASCIVIYRKAKRQFQKLRESFQQVDLSDRNYEISLMGGFLTMRVEQNPRRLLEAPHETVLDTEPVKRSAATTIDHESSRVYPEV